MSISNQVLYNRMVLMPEHAMYVHATFDFPARIRYFDGERTRLFVSRMKEDERLSLVQDKRQFCRWRRPFPLHYVSD